VIPGFQPQHGSASIRAPATVGNACDWISPEIKLSPGVVPFFSMELTRACRALFIDMNQSPQQSFVIPAFHNRIENSK
jgi:hypothetical protein